MRSSRRRLLVAAVLVGAVVVVVGLVGAGLAYRRFVDRPSPLAGNQQDPAPPLVLDDDPTRGGVALAGSGPVVAGPDVDLVVTAPAGATEMQIGLDPGFASTPWSPVAPTATVTIGDVGYRPIFARFRSGPDDEPSPVSVLGVSVDPHYAAATASATGLHRASWALPLAADVVMVRIEAGRIARGGVVAYDLDSPPPGDSVSRRFPLLGPAVIERNGEPFGRPLDGRDDVIRVFDQLVGEPLDGASLADGDWAVTSIDDPALAGSPPMTATVLGRSARPAGHGIGPDGEQFTPLVHELVIQLPVPLVPGVTYQLEPPADLVEPLELSVDPTSTVSPAVHVNQNGYGPNDLKVGYLSNPVIAPTVGSHREGMAFRVLDADSGSVVYEGATSLRPGGDELEEGDLTGTAVHELDFSPVADPGRYQVCVEEIGCSEPFPVDERVWDGLVVDIARAMYHQRSGVALGPPFTPVARPRPYHPDDGHVVYRSGFRLLDAQLDGGRFAGLVEARTDEVVPEAWGGHFDAGDWDRRIEHLYYVRYAVELVERHPDRFGSLTAGIPESGDAVPDLVDEALWTLDLFRRLQHADGGIPGGIEASEHPQLDSTSWTDPLAVFTFAPDPWASYVYAGVAAQAADVMGPIDPVRADDYLASALAAMEWAEAQPIEEASAEVVTAHRSVAAAGLYKATGDERWHQLFLDTTTLTDGVDAFLSCHEHTRCDAAWIYATTDPARTDPQVVDAIVASFRATADEISAAADSTTFGWTVENRFVPLIWGLGLGGAPNGVGLLRAWELTGDRTYLAAAQRSAAASLGANPTNTVYVTGVGRSPVRHPLVVDTTNGGLPVWPGTPVYGNHDLSYEPRQAWVEADLLGPAGVTPLPTEGPYVRTWVDSPGVPMFNEFTVFQSHGRALYVYGLLAAAGS